MGNTLIYHVHNTKQYAVIVANLNPEGIYKEEEFYNALLYMNYPLTSL